MEWMLRLEDSRILRDPAPMEAPPTPAQLAPAATPAPPRADLEVLLKDPAAQVRRAAALAIGRVGLAAGAPALIEALSDVEPEVRQMAAFALGLLGQRSAVAALVDVVSADPDPIVRGRAAEALGRLGDPSAGPAIGQMVHTYVQQGVLGAIDADDETYPVAPAVEAIRLGVLALARLKAYDPLASATLASDGQPVSRWWPIAAAYQQVGDPRALTILMHLATGPGRESVTFAVRGLGELKDRSAVPQLVRLLDPSGHDPAVVVAAVRALAEIGGEVPGALVDLLARRDLDANLRLEVVTALGRLKASAAADLIMDGIADPWPAMRAASIRALAEIDPQSFVLVLSSLPPDPHWSVRAAVAMALGALDYETAAPRLDSLLRDEDRRVVPAALATLARLNPPSAGATMLKYLHDEDPVVRLAASRAIGALKPTGGATALADAYRAGVADPTYVARAGALGALAAFGAAAALPIIEQAFGDRDWAVRVRAAQLASELDPAGHAQDAIRPAPGGPPPGVDSYGDPNLVAPPFAPQLYIETSKGTIQIELAVGDAPLTGAAIMALVRRGFYNGLVVHRVVPDFVVQMGDPRGDGEGGPGFTLRDEINERPYLRGTVGMALDWADTGGSQFFITHSPQPRLDGRYTVIGSVVGGMDVVDRLQQWDTIRRVRVWDGVSMSSAGP
jgi:cyclophilin family peptidyl-prolyl cis-trans isomerase/HEAT repeat protein